MRTPLPFQRPVRKSLVFLAAVLWLGAPLCEPVAANSLTHREIVELLGAADTSPDPSMEALTIFESLDGDDDELLTLEELAEALDFGELLVTTLYRRFDLGSDGTIFLDEWHDTWSSWAAEDPATSSVFLLDVPDSMADVRINGIQMLGSHNSYHIQPVPELDSPYFDVAPDLTQSIRYSHPPLSEQFSHQGIRQIELDILADPEGGLYADPWGPLLVELFTRLDLELEPVIVIPYDAEELAVMQQPGLKVLHLQDLDYASQCPTFPLCLEDLRDWSLENPGHLPIFVLVEAKDDAIDTSGFEVDGLADVAWNNPPPIDATVLAEIDSDILAVFEPEHLLTPADVRGDYATLREAILSEGWPTLEAAAGLVYFGLDNGGVVMDMYLALHSELSSQILFTSSPTDADRAAFVKRNDPFATDIPELVELGFLVRTRADFDTLQSVENDPSHRDQAFESGAQFVSTDYRVPNLDYSDYSVGFEDDAAVRCNIVNAPEGCTLGLPEASLALLQTSCLLTLGFLARSRVRRRSA